MFSMPMVLIIGGCVAVTFIIALVVRRMRERNDNTGDIYPLF